MSKKVAKVVFIMAASGVLSLLGFSIYFTGGLPQKPQPEVGRIYRLGKAPGYATQSERTQYGVTLVSMIGLILIASLTDYYFDPFDRRKWATTSSGQTSDSER